MRQTPKWRLIVVFALASLCTAITAFFFSEFIDYLFFYSITLINLQAALADIWGHHRYDTISNSMQFFSKVILYVIFVFYLYLFYGREKRRQYQISLQQVIKDTFHMAEGNFDHQIQTNHHNDLDLLATNINNIMLRLNEAMSEERHIEYTKNELITNVSHDLRTPLTSIVGYLRLIEQDQYRDEVALRHYTGIAYEKSLNLERLINELFEYTRMQDKKFVLKKVPISISEMLGQIISHNQYLFDKNNISCRESISEVQSFVLADGERLARVFENLIGNAILYGQDGKYIDILTEEKENQVLVKIINYGNPIPHIDLPHIFDRFYRAEKSRSTYTGGSGLGLAIAKSIITHHEGTIEVESDIEKTCFIVKLPKIDPN